ncbi:MAG: hypothetical protein A2X36_06810 [Elusimicrobia bacterium GWA2_69_24]|nr:MAG: hypothetical protein A2X36_06810 [Elusimicrobia bacterium GWA2_69_24]
MKKSLALASILGMLCGNPAAAALTRIGAAGGVGGKVLALAPEAGAVGRIMASGQTVYFKDQVSTGPGARMQVLLLDETVFTLGPNSELILDEFVYDPFTQTGKVAAKITQGVFRMVTGNVGRKRPSDVSIKLPTGTIGIRGTIVGGRVDGNTALVALLGPGGQNDANERPGSIAVQNAGVTVDITRPGYATKIEGPGIPPTPPFQLTPAQLAQLGTAPAPEASKSGESGASPAESGEKSLSEESGETTASAQGDLSQTVTTGGLAQDFNQTTVVASQTGGGIVDGPSTWDQVRNSVITGSGYYTISGVCSIQGFQSGSSNYSFFVDVDFGNKAVTNWSLGLNGGVLGNLSASRNSSTWPSGIPFGAGGAAAYVFTASDLSGATGFAGSNFTFQNAGGVAAQQMQMNLVYTDGSSSIAPGTASGTAPFQ